VLKRITPREAEVYIQFRQHVGPNFIAAGLRLQFHYNQIPGIHFKAAGNGEFREPLLKGIKDGMSIRFPNFPETGSIWITEVSPDPVHSSRWAFYLAGRCAVEQAFALTQLRNEIGEGDRQIEGRL